MGSDSEIITISHETWLRLSRLREGNETDDSLISKVLDIALEFSEDEENWDVEKVVNHCNSIDKKTKYRTIDEVFGDV